MQRLILGLLISGGLLSYGVRALAQRPREQMANELLTRWDVNRDGYLTAGEVPPQARPALARLARDAGLDPAEALPLDRLRQHLKQPLPRAAAERESPRQTAPQPAAEPSQSAAATVAPTPPAASASGAGAPPAQRSTKGFGSAASPAVVSSSREDHGGGATPSNQGQPASAPRERAGENNRVRDMAQAMLRRFDRNRNGVLEEEEWRRMRGNVAKSDANGDGILTIDELTVHLSEYGRGSGSSAVVSPSKSTDVSTRKAATAENRAVREAASRRSYRFRTATERVAEQLPRELRDWFLQNDRDGDGQIAMYEFASTWSAEKTRDFARLDLNNDGLVTPPEYLKAKTTP